MNQEQEKEYIVKVPVYTTKPKIVNSISYNEAIDRLKKDIDNYNKKGEKTKSDKRNKTKIKEIDHIDYFDSFLEKTPVLLVKITANDINLWDGFLQTETRINFKRDFKLGSENNFILFYPNFIGIDIKKLKMNWFCLIYEDPNKENDEIIKCAKIVLRQVLNLSIQNIKHIDVLNELKKAKTLSELSIKLRGVKFDENDVDAKYMEYLVDWRLKKEKEDKFEKIPSELAQEIIEEEYDHNEYQKKEAKFKIGKKEYKITTAQINDAAEQIRNTAEAIFTDSCVVYESELNKLYNTDFILEKLTPILINYLSSNDE